MTDATSSAPSIAGHLREHLGLLVSAGAFAFIALRILATAGWDVDTATAIIQRGGAADVALATTVSSLPLVAHGLLGFTAGATAHNIYYRLPLAWALTAPVLATCFLLIDVAMILFFAALPLFAWALRKRHSGNVSDSASRRPRSATPALVTLVTILFVTFAAVPYLPLEALETEDDVQVGYVIGEDGSRLYFLEDGPAHRVESLALDAMSRSLCRREPRWHSSTLLELVRGARYPICPDVRE
ncbi:MAG: hypothetical protein KAG80_02065 [Nocardioides sp.]|nr:hypothetical protein [Nocardioides sp.]